MNEIEKKFKAKERSNNRAARAEAVTMDIISKNGDAVATRRYRHAGNETTSLGGKREREMEMRTPEYGISLKSESYLFNQLSKVLLVLVVQLLRTHTHTRTIAFKLN